MTLRRVEPVRAWDDGDAVVILGRRGRTLRFEGEGAALAREALATLATPRSVDELAACLLARSEGASDDAARAAAGALTRALLRHGVLTESPAPQEVMPHPRRVLLAVSGAVAAVDAPALARLLLARGHEVRVALTRSARRFVSTRALEAITHAPVHRSLWGGAPGEPAPHVSIARWAELVAVYPCSASTLARIAAGDASELVSAAVCATRARVVVAPSMNASMWSSDGVQENVARLRERGAAVVHPALGVEVADAPWRRRDMLGPALQPEAFAAVLEEIAASLPLEGAAWDRVYAAGDGAARGWSVARDEEVASLLAEAAPPATHPRLLDAGCGAGALARGFAAAGYQVTGLDVSDAAVERASEADAGAGVTWLRDDVRASRLRARFDVITDRGCFHGLDREGRERYVRQAAAWLRSGGRWVLKVHAPGGAPCGTERFTLEALDAELAPCFERLSARRCEFGGEALQPAIAAAYARR
ncbi:MAG: flavoprotein [Polyangiales bacterium]